ncbi:MAG: hypothetical protein LBB72_03430 [Spirochaetaceae bacterium]|jgi:hypothetical protein|nr:hypothetical protein [Spirochaetaceae bacterium]
MKNLKKRTNRGKLSGKMLVLLAFALIGLMPLLTCKQPVSGTGNPGNTGNTGDGDGDGKVYLVDVSEETDWDYLVVATDGSCAFYNVDETSGIPTSVFFKPDKDADDGTTILFKENGLPDRMVTNGHIFYYGNFRGYQYDLAVIKPDNTIEYRYDIETETDWDAYTARVISGQGRSVQGRGVMDIINTGLDIIGHGIGIGTCGAMFVMPGFALGCATYLASEAGNLMLDQLEKAGVLNGTAADIGHIIIDALGCIKGSDPLDCIQTLSGIVTLIFGDDIDLLMGKSMEVYEVVRVIEGGDMTWTVLESPVDYAIAYGDGIFVAGDLNGNIMYSTDCRNWTKVKRPFPGWHSEAIDAIAYGDGTFVAASWERLAYSTNGTDWTEVKNHPISGCIYAIAYGDGKFVAGDWDGKMAYSYNGINWAAVTDSKLKDISAIAYGGGKFVAGGYNNNGTKIAYSSDGISWEVSNITFPTFIDTSTINAIAYGDDKFVAVGDFNGKAYSYDGINWITVSDKIFSFSVASLLNINAVAYGGGRFVLGGDYGIMAYSGDGINWKVVFDVNTSLPEPDIEAIAYGGGRFVAMPGNESIMYCDWPSVGGDSGGTPVPALSSGSVNRTSDTQAIIGFTAGEAGTAYYTVKDVNTAAPTNTAVRNGGVPLGPVTVGANSGKKVVTLTAGAKDIYVVVQDAAGNLSAPLKIAAAAYDGG